MVVSYNVVNKATHDSDADSFPAMKKIQVVDIPSKQESRQLNDIQHS